MIWKHFIIASYKWKTFWTGGVADWLTVHCDANVLVAVEHCIQIWQVVSLGIL
jgi:hypothetical protein